MGKRRGLCLGRATENLLRRVEGESRSERGGLLEVCWGFGETAQGDLLEARVGGGWGAKLERAVVVERTGVVVSVFAEKMGVEKRAEKWVERGMERVQENVRLV